MTGRYTGYSSKKVEKVKDTDALLEEKARRFEPVDCVAELEEPEGADGAAQEKIKWYQRVPGLRTFQSDFVRTIAYVMICRSFMKAYVDYQLQLLADEDGLENEDLANYFTLLQGILGGGALLFQLFLGNAVFQRLGILAASLFAPITIAASTISVIAAPSIYTGAAVYICDTLFGMTTDKNSTQMYWNVLNRELKDESRPLIQGVIKLAAMGIAGLIIVGEIELLDAISVAPQSRFIAIVLVLICLVWIFFLIRQKKFYVGQLRESIDVLEGDFDINISDAVE